MRREARGAAWRRAGRASAIRMRVCAFPRILESSFRPVTVRSRVHAASSASAVLLERTLLAAAGVSGRPALVTSSAGRRLACRSTGILMCAATRSPKRPSVYSMCRRVCVLRSPRAATGQPSAWA
eukprot:749047-Prymnesium_polylepis.2